MRLPAELVFACALAALSAGIVRLMMRFGTLDHPGARSAHTQPTPKGGGVGIVAAFVIGLIVMFALAGRARLPDAPAAGLLAACLGIAAISYLDDVRSWPFGVKLGAQLAAALLAIASGIRFGTLHLPWYGGWQTGWIGIPLTAAWILFATNAVNFIDGLDGLVGGAVAIACLLLSAIAWTQGDLFVHVAGLALAAGIAGFLPFNFPRARIFMGDVGSQSCGLVVAVLGILASRFGTQTLSVLIVPMLLAGIWFDAAFTLIRRALAGERITQAHRGHLYQVAHRAGMPTWSVAAVYWAMTAWGGGCCLLFAEVSSLLKPTILLAVLVPQALWLMTVRRLSRQAGLARW